MRTKTLTVGLLIMVTLAACNSRPAQGPRSGTARNTQLAPPASEGGANDYPINWDSPLVDGVQMSSVADAQPHVAFQIVLPGFLQPDLIQIDDPTQVSPDEETVAFVFHTTNYGTVVLQESEPNGWTVGQMQARANDANAPAGAFQMVKVKGIDALLIQGSGIGRVMWLKNGVLFNLTGNQISPQQVQNLASQT